MANDQANYKGNAGSSAGNLRADEQAILDALHNAERASRPGLLVLYFNGSNWLLYDTPRPRWLTRQNSSSSGIDG